MSWTVVVSVNSGMCFVRELTAAGTGVGATVCHRDAVSAYFRFSAVVQDGVFRRGRRMRVRRRLSAAAARLITPPAAAAAAAGTVLHDVIAVQ